jgi:hypothetical protein
MKQAIGKAILEEISKETPESIVDTLTNILQSDTMDQYDTVDELIGTDLLDVLDAIIKIESFQKGDSNGKKQDSSK